MSSSNSLQEISLRLSLIEMELRKKMTKEELKVELEAGLRGMIAELAESLGPGDGASGPDEDLLQGDQAAADFLKISKSTVYNYRREGRIPYKKLGHRVFFSKKSLIAAMWKGSL